MLLTITIYKLLPNIIILFIASLYLSILEKVNPLSKAFQE